MLDTHDIQEIRDADLDSLDLEELVGCQEELNVWLQAMDKWLMEPAPLSSEGHYEHARLVDLFLDSDDLLLADINGRIDEMVGDESYRWCEGERIYKRVSN